MSLCSILGDQISTRLWWEENGGGALRITEDDTTNTPEAVDSYFDDHVCDICDRFMWDL